MAPALSAGTDCAAVPDCLCGFHLIQDHGGSTFRAVCTCLPQTPTLSAYERVLLVIPFFRILGNTLFCGGIGDDIQTVDRCTGIRIRFS